MKGFIIDKIERDFNPNRRISEIRERIESLNLELNMTDKGSRSEVRTQAEKYNLLLELMDIADKDIYPEADTDLFPNFRKNRRIWTGKTLFNKKVKKVL